MSEMRKILIHLVSIIVLLGCGGCCNWSDMDFVPEMIIFSQDGGSKAIYCGSVQSIIVNDGDATFQPDENGIIDSQYEWMHIRTTSNQLMIITLSKNESSNSREQILEIPLFNNETLRVIQLGE